MNIRASDDWPSKDRDNVPGERALQECLISKSNAAEWAIKELPGTWAELIERDRIVYLKGPGKDQPVPEEVATFSEYCFVRYFGDGGKRF